MTNHESLIKQLMKYVNIFGADERNSDKLTHSVAEKVSVEELENISSEPELIIPSPDEVRQELINLNK